MYPYDKPDNLVEMFESSVTQYPDNPLFGTKNPQRTYDWVTYREVGKRVDNLRGGLAQLGVGKDDVVGIISRNRVEWAVAAFATYGLGARFISMYETEVFRIWKYIVADGAIKVLFVATPAIYLPGHSARRRCVSAPGRSCTSRTCPPWSVWLCESSSRRRQERRCTNALTGCSGAAPATCPWMGLLIAQRRQ